ncbi:thioesterase family protein [uncultured Pseudoteredinibacter sp.]|uniref:acyl-CoA thioesterase n=1 Tax=uncultured Pseudoteredinibacter sp. TaxID=1641701 RepID=UPI00262EFA55|nr:thioesterase family protein [uncultured Pseudoteredinibacter sp.]
MEKPNSLSIETTLEIPFHDVDLMGVSWHGHYVKYLEIARCKLLDSIDYNYMQMQESGYAWPVIDMRLRYAKPAKFQQKVKIIATIIEWEHRLKISYLIRDLVSEERITKAYTVQVAVDISNGEMLFASPPALIDRVEANL